VTFGPDLQSSSITAKTAEELIVELDGAMFCLLGRQAHFFRFVKTVLYQRFCSGAIIEEIPLLATRRRIAFRRWTETLPRGWTVSSPW
jgi:hypothetical protein